MSDYISRDALKEAFDNADADVCESYSDGYCDWGFGRKNINDVIDGVPAADVEDVEAPQGISKICPQCGKEFTQGKIKQKIYCSLECQKAHAQRAAQRRYRDRKNKELEAHE